MGEYRMVSGQVARRESARIEAELEALWAEKVQLESMDDDAYDTQLGCVVEAAKPLLNRLAELRAACV